MVFFIFKMLEKDFLQSCETALIALADRVEALDVSGKLEVDYADGILNIVISESGATYVINRNSGNQKIWYSSPFSGANYFSFDGSWKDAKGEELTEKLLAELQKIL